MRMQQATCDYGESSHAGERRDVDAHALEAGGELCDGVDPFSERSHALQPVQDDAAAENQLVLHQVGSGWENRK